MVSAEHPAYAPRQGALKPPLKWAGGKRWQIPHLTPIWQKHRERRLVEPFCGGMGMALGLRPRRGLFNDVNPHLINFYRCLQDGLRVPIPMANDETLFYTHRSRFNALLRDGASASAEAASLFYFLNRTAYNGLCRFNRRGEFNVPFGQYKRIAYETDFSAYVELFRDWVFTAGHFAHVPLAPDDFVYADPPYDVKFTAYAAGGFSWNDQVHAAQWLAAHPGPVVLVNQATPRIVRLYKDLDYRVSYLAAPRRIACTGNRAPAQEVVALRNV